MGSISRLCMSLLFLAVAGFCLVSCDKKSDEKQVAKIEVTASEYNLRQTHENSYVLDVKGKVKNTGNVDVKKVIVTGYCRSCILEFTGHRWFTSDCDKTENQKDTISYLVVGAEEEFSFEEVAFYFTHSKVPPENIPEKIEIVIESFETVE